MSVGDSSWAKLGNWEHGSRDIGLEQIVQRPCKEMSTSMRIFCFRTRRRDDVCSLILRMIIFFRKCRGIVEIRIAIRYSAWGIGNIERKGKGRPSCHFRLLSSMKDNSAGLGFAMPSCLYGAFFAASLIN